MKKDIEWLKNEVNELPLKFLGFSMLKQREELGVINMNSLIRENNFLKKENERLGAVISEVKVTVETLLGGN